MLILSVMIFQPSRELEVIIDDLSEFPYWDRSYVRDFMIHLGKQLVSFSDEHQTIMLQKKDLDLTAHTFQNRVLLTRSNYPKEQAHQFLLQMTDPEKIRDQIFRASPEASNMKFSKEITERTMEVIGSDLRDPETSYCRLV